MYAPVLPSGLPGFWFGHVMCVPAEGGGGLWPPESTDRFSDGPVLAPWHLTST